jgi:hypothetical protein
VTRAIGAGMREVPCRLAPAFAPVDRERELDLPVAALRVELVLPRFVLAERVPRADDAERLDDALRELDAAADFPRDFVRFVAFFPRDELLLLDFPRDFLALVAIDASPRSR